MSEPDPRTALQTLLNALEMVADEDGALDDVHLAPSVGHVVAHWLYADPLDRSPGDAWWTPARLALLAALLAGDETAEPFKVEKA
jgi:hypothetical protein